MSTVDNEPTQIPEYLQAILENYSRDDRFWICESLVEFARLVLEEESVKLDSAFQVVALNFQTNEDLLQLIEWVGLETTDECQKLRRKDDYMGVGKKVEALMQYVKTLPERPVSDFLDERTDPAVLDARFKAALSGKRVDDIIFEDLDVPQALRGKYIEIEEGDVLTSGRIIAHLGHNALLTYDGHIWISDKLFGRKNINAAYTVYKTEDGVKVTIGMRH
ncbi:hypothetical protein ACFL3C_01120 [Patescibacteria group bacterium]